MQEDVEQPQLVSHGLVRREEEEKEHSVDARLSAAEVLRNDNHPRRPSSAKDEEDVLRPPSPLDDDDDDDNDNDGGVNAKDGEINNNTQSRGWKFWCIVFSPFLCFGLVAAGFFIAAAIVSNGINRYSMVVEPVPDNILAKAKANNNADAVAKKAPANNNNASTSQSEVVIVGSGIAGMFAGYTLSYLGISNFTILEAGATYGGRIQRTNAFTDAPPIDLGPEWIHTHPQILQDLLLYDEDKKKVDTNIETINYQPQSYSFYSNANGDGKRKRFDLLKFFYKEYKFKNTTWSQYIENYILPYIQDNIVYSAIVKEIDYSNSSSKDDKVVQVTTTDGTTYTASKVIVAVPISVLQQNDIAFVPELPSRITNALQHPDVQMQPGLKVFIEFQDKFYTDMTFMTSFWNMMNEDGWATKLYFDGVFGKDQTNKNIMTLFCVGDPSKSLVNLNDEELINTILQELDTLYDGMATKNYVQHLVQNWSQEPYIRGSYAFGGVDPQSIVEPIGNKKIYFAGDYLAGDWASTVNGAAVTGRSAAVSVVAGL